MKVDVRDVIAAVEKSTKSWTALEIKDLLLKLAIKETEVAALRSSGEIFRA